MKKRLSTIFALIISLALVFSLVSCDGAQASDDQDAMDFAKAGLEAYNEAVENGFEGSMIEWLQSLSGKDGVDGKDGIDGEDGAPGNDGVDGADGADGKDGEDAYDAAVANGFDGTYEEWLSLITDGSDFVLITKYAKPDTGKDVADQIQQAIDENPNKTIYFPDGIYLISKPILTCGKPSDSVSLKLANYATIKAASNWENKCTDVEQSKNGTYSDAMIRLGAKDAKASGTNDIATVGSNYFFEGGIIDGSGVANGISIDGGRETRIANVSIKHTQIGLHIKNGANNGSSDADIMNVNIIGNGDINSTGVLCRGYDNTFTNMRIARVQYGFHLTGGGNFIRNVHPLYTRYKDLNSSTYNNSIGFWEESGGNFFDNAYSDQFATGFLISGNKSIFDNCFAFWYADHGTQTAFKCNGKFNSIITNARVGFNRETSDNIFFYTTTHGMGKILSPIFNPGKCASASNNYSNYVTNDGIIRA